MVGSIALVGSGEYLPAMATFERSLIDDAMINGKSNSYFQIPTAAGRESADRLDYWRRLGQMQAEVIGAEAQFLPIYNREDALDPKYSSPEFLRSIESAGLIYLSGGDPHHLANSLRDTPLWDAIVKAWQSGSSLAGCSAGAMVLSSEIPNFRLLKNPPTPGLNLLAEIRVIPHFNKFFKWIPDSAAKILLQVPSDAILIGVDELTAIVKRCGMPDWVVFGEAKVHLLKGMPDQQLINGQRIELKLND